MADLGLPEILIVVVIAMLLFGSARMPDIARSLGRSLRIAKAELRGLRDDDAPTADASSADAPTEDVPAPADPHPVVGLRPRPDPLSGRS